MEFRGNFLGRTSHGSLQPSTTEAKSRWLLSSSPTEACHAPKDNGSNPYMIHEFNSVPHPGGPNGVTPCSESYAKEFYTSQVSDRERKLAQEKLLRAAQDQLEGTVENAMSEEKRQRNLERNRIAGT
jgi:hypothetical protein